MSNLESDIATLTATVARLEKKLDTQLKGIRFKRVKWFLFGVVAVIIATAIAYGYGYVSTAI